jgi:hypothetical protein
MKWKKSMSFALKHKLKSAIFCYKNGINWGFNIRWFVGVFSFFQIIDGEDGVNCVGSIAILQFINVC